MPSSLVNHLGFYVVVVVDGLLFLQYYDYAAIGDRHRAYFDLRRFYHVAPDPHWSHLTAWYHHTLQQWKDALNVTFAQASAAEPPRNQKPVNKKTQKPQQPVKPVAVRNRR